MVGVVHFSKSLSNATIAAAAVATTAASPTSHHRHRYHQGGASYTDAARRGPGFRNDGAGVVGGPGIGKQDGDFKLTSGPDRTGAPTRPNYMGADYNAAKVRQCHWTLAPLRGIVVGPRAVVSHPSTRETLVNYYQPPPITTSITTTTTPTTLLTR